MSVRCDDWKRISIHLLAFLPSWQLSELHKFSFSFARSSKKNVFHIWSRFVSIFSMYFTITDLQLIYLGLHSNIVHSCTWKYKRKTSLDFSFLWHLWRWEINETSKTNVQLSSIKFPRLDSRDSLTLIVRPSGAQLLCSSTSHWWYNRKASSHFIWSEYKIAFYWILRTLYYVITLNRHWIIDILAVLTMMILKDFV